MSSVAPLTILFLHRAGPLSDQRRVVARLLLGFCDYAPEHKFVFHDANWPITPALRSVPFDAVFLDSTILESRWLRPRHKFYRIKEALRFLAELECPKLAFPQDDYDHCDALDQWLDQLNVDAVYTPLFSQADQLLPSQHAQGKLVPNYTGYIDDAIVDELAKWGKPWKDRTIDIGYRAKRAPFLRGWFGRGKSEIGYVVDRLGKEAGLKTDISCRPEDTILGDAWLAFLGDCRWTTGCESGSSLVDRDGAIRDKIQALVQIKPQVGFDEVAGECFPKSDFKIPFAAPGPRLFEAAILKSPQLLVEGHYVEGFQPGVHYVPIQWDGRGFHEALPILRDEKAATRIADACYEYLVEDKRFRFSNHVREVVERLEKILLTRPPKSVDDAERQRLLDLHDRQLKDFQGRCETNESSTPPTDVPPHGRINTTFPETLEAALSFASRALDRGDIAAAKAAVDNLMAANDGMPETWILLGRLALMVGQLQTAGTALVRATVLKPDSVEAYRLLTQTYREMGDREAARTAMDIADGIESLIPVGRNPL